MHSGSILLEPGDTLPIVKLIIISFAGRLQTERCSCSCYRYLVEILLFLIDLLLP
jgi:hypothetical protein